jgi:ribose transport system ATP-binding protein
VAPALALHGLSKGFGGVRALDGVSLEVLPGEVHGLLGENGSGKSTLVKILAGFHAPDEGELEVRGEPVRLPLAPGQFRRLGMSFVHQDLGLVPTLSVTENLRVGELAQSRGKPFISWRRRRREARETFARYGIRVEPGRAIADLRPVERALVAIVRAVEEMREVDPGRGLLVLDEPTVFLPRADVDQLFALVRQITAGGASVLFVSHDLDEVHEITDRVTVLRDGRVVGTVVTSQAAEGQMVEMIVGRRLAAFSAEHHDLTARAADVSVRGLSGRGVREVSLDLHRGEVLGITGLVGSGFEEVPYLLYGAARAATGTLAMDAGTFRLPSMSPHLALAAGMALLPGDRQRDGSVGTLSVTDNVTLPVLPRFRGGVGLRRGAMLREARRLMADFDVRPPQPRLDYGSLSGGNQQKALLAKWLQTSPRLLLLHEPTQGVDVGARQQIFSTIRAAAAEGACILCASSDYEQLAAICDRVLVFGRGRVVRQLVGGEVTKDRITEQCYASMAAVAAAPEP